MKIRRGDTVKILSGKDRGRSAKVLRVFPETCRLLVEGINIKKRHIKAKRADRKGEIVLMPAPIAASAAALACPHCGKPTRVGYTWDDRKKKVRQCKKCSATFQ